MKPNTETIKCAPLKNARELAVLPVVFIFQAFVFGYHAPGKFFMFCPCQVPFHSVFALLPAVPPATGSAAAGGSRYFPLMKSE